MIQVAITPIKWWQRKRRRALPSSWNEVPVSRLPFVINLLLQMDRDAAMPVILQYLLQVPPQWLSGLSEDNLAALLYQIQWIQLAPTETPSVSEFKHKGITYFFPAEKFSNGSAIEYPLADEYYSKYLSTQDPDFLLLLTATLCRERKSSQADIDRTGDARVPLNSRAEVQARKNKISGLAIEYQVFVLFYFAGIKQMIHRIYGETLFSQEEDGNTGKDGSMFGWWGIYMDLAENITNLDKIYQMNFHTICMLLVKRRKEAQKRELEARINSKSWGNDSNG